MKRAVIKLVIILTALIICNNMTFSQNDNNKNIIDNNKLDMNNDPNNNDLTNTVPPKDDKSSNITDKNKNNKDKDKIDSEDFTDENIPKPKTIEVGPDEAYKPLSEEEIILTDEKVEKQLPKPVVGIRTIKGIKAIQFGEIDWIKEPETMKRITNQLATAIQNLNAVEIKIGEEIQKANEQIDELENSENKCEEVDCLAKFGEIAGVNIVVYGIITLERGEYFIKLEILDLRYSMPTLMNIVSKIILSIEDGDNSPLKKALPELSKELFVKYIKPPADEIINGKVYINVIDEDNKPISGAEIYINGTLHGLTPIYTEGLKYGTYKLDIKWQYNLERKLLVIDTKKVINLTIQLIHPKGKLFIYTDPQSAIVYINDMKYGRTPLELENMPYGFYTVRFKLNYYSEQTQTIELNRQQFLFSKKLTQTGLLKVRNLPPDATLKVNNGKETQTAYGNTEIYLPAGTWNVNINSKDYKTYNDKIEIKHREVYLFNPSLQRTDKWLQKQISLKENERFWWNIYLYSSITMAVGMGVFAGYMINQRNKKIDEMNSYMTEYSKALRQTDMDYYYSLASVSYDEAKKNSLYADIGIGLFGAFTVSSLFFYFTLPSVDDIKQEGMDLSSTYNLYITPDKYGKGYEGHVQYSYRF